MHLSFEHVRPRHSCAWNPSKERAAHCTHRAGSDDTQDVALSLLHFVQKRILSLTLLALCCHLCPPLNRPGDEGRGYQRRDSRGDRCAFLRRSFLLAPAGHTWFVSHDVLCLLSPSCERHRQMQLADLSHEVPSNTGRASGVCRRVPGKHIHSYALPLRRRQKYNFRFIPILVRADQ